MENSTSDERIRVTVPGPPVEVDVTWEQVRAYLRAKGWTLCPRSENGVELWKCPGYTDPPDPSVFVGCFPNQDPAEALVSASNGIVYFEGRDHVDVLRDIAAIGRPRHDDPARLTEDELAEIAARANAATPGPWTVDQEHSGFWQGRFGVVCQHGTERRGGETSNGPRILLTLNGNFEPGGDTAFIAAAREDVPRLLATVRAQAEEIARLLAVVDALPRCGGDGGPCGRIATWNSGVCDRHVGRIDSRCARELSYAPALRALGIDPEAP